jgi:uncharacterized membrane protein
MKKLSEPGRVMYAIGLIGLAVISFISKDFIVGRPPAWPASLSLDPALAYVSGTILIILCLGIIFKKRPCISALLIALLIFFLSVIRALFHFMNDWVNGYKAIALMGGALIVAASFLENKHNIIPNASVYDSRRRMLIIAGTIFIAPFLIAGGYAHFKYADFVKDFIPAYVPFHVFWTYFCGVCLIAGGIGILLRPTIHLASLLCGIMIFGWFILLHIPRFVADMNNVSDRMGLCESFAFAGVFFTLAAMTKRTKRTTFNQE